MEKTLSKQPLPVSPAASCPLFEALSANDIVTILRAARREEHPRRSRIFHQGEPARQFYLLESGLLRLGQLTAEGEDVFVRIVKPGEVFGYFALTPKGFTAASSCAIQDSRLAVWERDIVLQVLQSVPQAAINLFNIAARDVLYARDYTRRLLTEPVSHRVRWALSELSCTAGIQTDAGVVISDGIGQKELADLAGTTVFTVSRELGKLERQGVLEKGRGRIVVLNPAKFLEEL